MFLTYSELKAMNLVWLSYVKFLGMTLLTGLNTLSAILFGELGDLGNDLAVFNLWIRYNYLTVPLDQLNANDLMSHCYT